MTPDEFFQKPYDQRHRWAWWRFADPYDWFMALCEHGYRTARTLRLSDLTEVFGYILDRHRERFDKLVQAKAEFEIHTAVAQSIDLYRANGYLVADDLGEMILRDLVSAVIRDEIYISQAEQLRLMRPSRKALIYRIWALWDVMRRYEAGLTHDRISSAQPKTSVAM